MEEAASAGFFAQGSESQPQQTGRKYEFEFVRQDTKAYLTRTISFTASNDEAAIDAAYRTFGLKKRDPYEFHLLGGIEVRYVPPNGQRRVRIHPR